MDFQDRHVIVTGGTGALGCAVTEALLESGAICHVSATSEAKAQTFPYRSNPRVKLITTGSLADEKSVDALFDAVPSLWASIHLAGGYAGAPIGDIDSAALMRQLQANFVTCFLCCRAAVKSMTNAGNGGRIVNVAARPALEWRHGAGMTAYAASKSAVASLTAALADEVVKDGILVNAVVPSTMDTPENRAAMPKANFDKWPKVDEVADTILFLASPENKATRGGLVPVYGRS